MTHCPNAKFVWDGRCAFLRVHQGLKADATARPPACPPLPGVKECFSAKIDPRFGFTCLAPASMHGQPRGNERFCNVRDAITEGLEPYCVGAMAAGKLIGLVMANGVASRGRARATCSQILMPKRTQLVWCRYVRRERCIRAMTNGTRFSTFLTLSWLLASYTRSYAHPIVMLVGIVGTAKRQLG